MKHAPSTAFILLTAACGVALALSVYGQKNGAQEILLQRAIQRETVDGDLAAATKLYKEILANPGPNRPVAAQALLRLGGCYEKLGEQEARVLYERLIAEYADQPREAAVARERLAALSRASREQRAGPTFGKISIPGELSPGAQMNSDGTRIAMVSGGEIWVVNLQGAVAPGIAGVPVRLTQGANAAWAGVTWSHNGQWIAFNESRIPSRDIFVVPASGGESRKVSRTNPILGTGPWWLGLFSDGDRVVYSTRQEGRLVLQMVSINTGEVLMRFASPDALEPRLSPDERYLAYNRVENWTGDPFGEMRILRLADRSEFTVTKTRARFRSPAWSPDGGMLAFLAHPDKSDPGVQELWVAPVSADAKTAGEPARIRLPRMAASITGWAAGNRIGLLSTSPSRNAVYTVPLSGGKATQVTPEGDTYNPQWSPDGTRIYFRWGRGDIAYVPAAGGSVHIVPRTGAPVRVSLPNGGNHISPDGERIVWAGARDGTEGVHLWTLSVSGGEPARLPMKPELDSFQPRWSPDGKWIAFDSERDVEGERKLDENIFIVSSEGGEPRQLTNHRDCFCELLAWSPAGDSIAYACSDQVIRIVPAGGGQPRTVLKAEGLRTPGNSLEWTIDGTRLVYTARGRLWAVSTAGGEPRAIGTDLDGNIQQFALSPDGRTIAFNAPSGGNLELLLMDNFLHLVKLPR